MLKLRLVLILAVFCFNAQARIKSVEVKNASLNFVDQSGRATIDLFNMTFDFGKLDLMGYDIDITKGEGNLLFNKDDTSFRLDGIDQSVLDAIRALSAERIDFKGIANKSLKLDFKHGAISLGDEVHGLNELTIDCFTNTRGDDTLVSFLIPCFDNGKIDIPTIHLAQKSAQRLAALWEHEPVEREKRSIFLPKKLEDIKINIVEQKFDLSLKARFIFKLKLKINGTAVLNQKKNIAVFDIQQAKVGFVNVKKILIKMLAKLDVTNVSVEGSIITVKL